MKYLIYIAMASVVGLTGCGGSGEVKTKSYYIENDDERIARVKHCKELPNEKLYDANCINALDAEAAIKMAKMLGTTPKSEG